MVFSSLDQFKIAPLFCIQFAGIDFSTITFLQLLLLVGVIALCIICKDLNKNFLNNQVITAGSFIITPPKGFGKISMISWVTEQYQESFFIITLILASVFMLLLSILVFFFYHVTYKKDEFFINEVLPYFKKLSPGRKIVFGVFTVFTAIPNKMYVNVNIHFIFVLLISVCIYCLGLVIPFFFFCYIFYLMICFESFIFGMLYENSDNFKKFTNFLLFGDSKEPFAANYFYWFWGNMWQGGARKFGTFVAGGAMVEAQRQAENQKKNDYADKHTELASTATNSGFKTPADRAAFHKDRREEWVNENGTVTKFLQAAEKQAAKTFDDFL